MFHDCIFHGIPYCKHDVICNWNYLLFTTFMQPVVVYELCYCIQNDVNVLFASRMVRLFMLIGCQPKIRNQAKYRVRINDVVLCTMLVLKYLCLCSLM